MTYRLPASQVLQHPFILRANHSAPAPEFDNSHHQDIKRVNDILYQFVAPSHMVGLKRKQSVEVSRLQNEEGVHDMAHSVLELISLDIFVLKKALDVLVAVSLLERAPLARAFLRCGLAHKLGMLAREYHYMKMYTQRHLPRSAKLLVHIAGHQDRDMLRKIIAVEQFEKTRGDGRILFELMAYGTQVLDAEHRANCMYFMAVTFALSSADAPMEAQRDLSISTQDLVKFFRIDGVQQPEQLQLQVKYIISMFVELLETLTWTREGSACSPLISYAVYYCNTLLLRIHRTEKNGTEASARPYRFSQATRTVQQESQGGGRLVRSRPFRCGRRSG